MFSDISFQAGVKSVIAILLNAMNKLDDTGNGTKEFVKQRELHILGHPK